VVTTGFSSGKTQNSSAKPVDTAKPREGQSIVVNNNCGLGKTDREMMSYIKAKVDYIAAQSGKGSSCSNGWVAFGKSCFYVIDIPTLEENAARRNCQKLGGRLPKITSAAENQFIYDLINGQKKTTRAGAWLGLQRRADMKFYWADGTPLAGYTAWYPGEPNSRTDSCVHIFGKADFRRGKWNDLACTLQDAEISYAPVVVCQKHYAQ